MEEEEEERYGLLSAGGASRQRTADHRVYGSTYYRWAALLASEEK